MSDHYTAQIKITKTKKPDASPVTRGTPYGNNDAPKEREVTEVASIIVRAKTLSSLVSKAKRHLEITEEEDE